MTSRKQLAINQRALYDDAVKNKMFWNATPSFQEFQRRLQNPKYVQTVQANYRAHGRSGDAFDTLSGFRDYFCVSDEDKQDMTQGVGNMIANTKARLAGQQRYNKLKQHQDKQRGRYGRLDLGVKNPLTNDNVVREPLTGRYLTSDGAEYAQEYEAARAQNHIDETGKRYTEAVERGDLPSAFEVQDEDGNYALMEDLGVKPGVHVTEKGKQQQLAGLVNTRKSVEEQYNALYRKLEEDFKRSAPFSINTHSQYGIDDNNMRLQAYLNSNAQYRRLKAQLHQLDNAIGVGEEAVKGRAEERYVKNAKGMLGYAYRDLKSFGASALRGLWNAVSDVSTWDMGLQDLQDNMTLYTTVKKARQKGYKNLNSEERQMLDVAAKTGAYTAENQQYLGRGYKAGNVTGESLPFMVEMALNPASGLGEAVMSKYMRNAIAKYGKEAVRKEAWKYVTKKCGYRVAGDVLGAALMTGTTGSARTLADTYDRLTGDIKSTYDSNGKIVYDGTENEEKGILKAYLKAFGATAIENHSEFVGEYFNPLLKGVGTLTMKGWKKVNAKSANAFLDNLKDMGSTSTAKWLGNLFDKTQWHGTIGEYAEEVVGNIENALLVGDSTLDTKEGTGVFNLDQNIDTFLGVSLMGGFFSTLKTGAYVRDKVKGERKILMQQSLDLDNSIRYALGADPRLADKWKEWRVALAQGTDEEKKQALKEISENTNGNIKKAMYDYSANAQKLAGMDKATQGAIEDGTITPEQAQRDADIEQAHEEGLAAEGTARHDIQQEHQLRENSLARMLGISAEQLDRMEDEDIESMTGQNDALDTAIYDYQTSRERYQGVIDRATDEVEQAGIDAAHQIDLYTDHSTGQIRPCVIKGNNGKEDYQGYIVNGNIATHPDGAIDVSGSDKMILYFDPETGKIEHGDASTFASLGESADATVARQQAIDAAKQQAAQAQSRDIDGGVGEDGNVSEAMPTSPQSSDQEERNAADFDIGQVVNAETGEVIPVSFEGLAEGENAYLTGGRPDGKTKDRLKVTIVDAEGNVTNRVMKRGNVQVDGRMSAEDFRNAYEEAVSSRMAPEADMNGQENNVDEEGVVAGNAAPSADKAATSEEEGAASEPAVRDKNGNPIYDKMPISATIADLYDGALDDAEIDGFVSAQIAEAEKAVEKMEKKKPKVGTDKAKYLADKKAWEEGLQEAQRKVQYWQDVKAEVEKITTPEDARGYEEELNGDAAQTAYRNGSDAAAYGAREVTAEFMQSGDVKITPESYRKETGFGAAEQRAMVGKISKGGKSIDKLAEDLEVFDRENYNGMYFGGDSSVAKDAILDYLSSPDSRKGVKKMQSEAEREYVEAYEAERDRYYQEKYHMSYEEYLVYSSQEMPELLRKYSNFDEQLFLERYADEIEAALQKREEQLKQEENGKEGNVSAGEESGHGRSNQVQSGERTDDIGRGEVGKDSAGEVGPRHEGVVESEAASKETITPEQQSLLSRPNSSQYTAERESSDHKATNNTDTKQENEEKSAKALSNKQSSGQAKMSHKEKTGEKEAMSPTPAMIDRMIEEQRVDDVSELLISSELKKAAEDIAEAFGMKVVYLKKVFIKSDDPAVEDFEGNGFVRNGVIYLSLKEANIAQFTFGHELLHQLKQIDADSYMRIRQKVIAVMGRKAFEMEVKARQMTYANVPGYTLFEDYAEEVIADTLGDIITHTDMLPDIARSLKENPSLLDRFLNVVDNVRQYFRGKIGGALGDLVNDIRNTYEMTARQGAERDKFSLRLAEAKNNTDKNPSQAQKESGNYRKGHIRFGGYNYTIENPQGSYRSGVDENGKKWKQKMNNTYGYILGTKGKDGDHLDMFINDKADLDSWNGNVYVVDQVLPDGSFDEHKVMYGFDSEEDARKAYLSNYEQGWQGLGNITGVSKEDFDRWLEKSGRKTKAFSEYSSVKKETEGNKPSEASLSLSTPLTDEEVVAITDVMKANATVAPTVEINDANWKESVDTPIGAVKMGENQKAKLFAKGREQQYGMLLETLSNPDVVLEEKDKEQNMFHERPSSYLFVKTFQKEDGSKYVHFESVTVSQEGMEVSISSHIIRENQLKNKLKSDRLLYKATALDAPANTSAEQPIVGGSLSSDGKDTEKVSSGQEDGEKNVLSDLEREFQKALEHEEDVEQKWEDKIQDYVAEHYPTQATVSAATTSAKGVQEREAMKSDHVLRAMREKADAEYKEARDATFAAQKEMETAKEKMAKVRLQKDEGYSEFAEKHGVSADDVRRYVEGMLSGNLALANQAFASIRVAKRRSMVRTKLSEFAKIFSPIEKELYKRFGNINDLREEHVRRVEEERSMMEAARKRAEEEQRNREARLEELAVLTDEEIDHSYAEALAKGDVAAAREMLDEAARRKGYGDVRSDYQGVGAWSAPSNPDYETDEARRNAVGEDSPDLNVEDMAAGYSNQPEDIFVHPNKYSQGLPTSKESGNAIQTAIDDIRNGKKDVTVKVYRAVPTSVKEGKLRNGDWVTPSRKYAELHGSSRLEGKYRIIEDEVPVSELWWDGNDVNEWGYDNGKGYRYKNVKNNRKLNDLVTRDDNGNVIPPSKRFNQRKADERFQRGIGGVKPSKAEAVLRDAVIDRLRENGMEVITDVAEGQKVLDEANGDVREMSFGEPYDYEAYPLGRVEPNLADREVMVVRTDADHGFMNYKEAKAWAKQHVAKVYNNEETGGKGDVRISNAAIDKFMSQSAVDKSDGKDVHMSVLKVLPEVLKNSIDVETHPDFLKGEDGKRRPENGMNKDVLVHRCYGAVSIDGKPYRVKITLKEEMRNKSLPHNTHSYEATKIELLAGTLVKPKGDNPNTNNSISAAKLLENVVMSYNPGEKVLDASEKRSAGLREQRVYHGSGADGVRFFRTANGEAYGFTVGGRIYVDPRIATSETPVHEYAHLWATALRNGNAEEWQNVVGLMKDSKVWDEVKERYPELKSDDEIADEVIATYSGRRGAERLREEQRKIAEGDGGVFEKAEAISALEHVKRALKMFWKGVADFLHIHYKSAEEVADRVMKDLLEGVDPRKMGEDVDRQRYASLGVSRSLGEEAGEGEPRYQFIGEKGAAEADHAEEVSVRLDNLSVAREMEAEKKDAKAIKMATGWERGADGKWRYEIADMKEFDRNGNLLYRKHHPDYARYIELQDKDLKNLLEDGEKLTDKEREEYEALSKKYESDKFGGEKLDNIHTLEAYVDAPELFKAYPELRNVRVTFKDTGGWETASYYAISDVIDFNVDDVGEIVVNTGKVTANMRTKELKSVFLHEIQHAIQVIEGFAEGGSPQYMKGLYSDYFLQDYSSSQLHELAELRRIAENKVKRGEYKRMSYAVKNVIKAAKEHGFYPTWAESFDNNPNSVTTVYDTLVKFPSEILDKAVLIDERDLYNRVAGEVEARNVQERMDMSAEERRASLAAETEDVAREDQIFLMGDGVSEMGSRVGKRMAEIGEHYEDRALTDEERPIVDVFCGRNDNLKVSIERDGKSLVLMMRQGSENGAGTKHCLYRHYGTGVGYLTADDILKIPYIMANGFAKEKLRGKSRLVEYTYKDEQGCEYTLLTEKKKGFEIFNDFYTNRKASSLSTFNTSEDAHTGSDNALMGAKLGNVSETAKESEGKDRRRYASLGVSRALGEEAAKGEPRGASLGLSEQQLDGDDTIRFSLNYDKWNREMASWLKRNRLPKNAQRPVVPQREAGESDLHFAGRLAKYNQDKALWNTAPKYEGHLSSGMTARGEFNYELQRGFVLKRIAIQDSMLAIRKAQEAIARHSGLLKVGTFEDAYMAENNSHGKAKNEFEQYDQEYLEPLRKWFNVMMKRLDGSYNNVTNYMIAKHGLERNAHMAFMAALEAEAKKAIGNTQPDAKRLRAQMVHDAYRQYKADSRRLINDADYEAGKYDYAQWRRTDDAIRKSYCSNYESFRYDKGGVVRDYAGLSSLFLNETDFEEKAAELCADIESKNGHETGELWDAVRQATRQILKNSHDAGMMSDETYDYVRGMYEHYIPLRGWNDSAADEVWDYAGGGRGVFNAALKEAHGRQSLADDPVAYIMNMAESGFLVNNRNWVKQHFLTMAMNHPTDLLTVSKAWYVKTKDQFGNEVWIPASPNIPVEETDPAVIQAALDAFQTKMEQMEQSGDATQQRGSLNIEYPQTKSEEREHEVRVMKDGEEYVVYVNGDPQLAQALNNTRAMRVREHEGNFEKACAWLGRKMAAVYTSLSPLFVPSNWARDTTMTLASTAIREDARYNWLLRTKFMRPDVQMRMFGLVKEYQNGKLREKVKSNKATKMEENFWNFMINGGETGFVSTMDVDAFREKIQRDLKDMGRTRLNPVKVGHTIADSVEYINRVIEDSNRFAIYQTSIEYGRGIEEAVQDAKNVTLNFNRKGTGEMGMSAIRQLYLFINPAIQSLQTLGALAKDHKAKFTAVTSAWMASGMLVPLFNELMFNLASAAAGGGGDDDDEFNPKEEYWKFSSFDRRNNCILWIPFTHDFIKIPLAQEFRGFYGIGDMVASAMWGGENAKESWSNYAADLMGQIIDLSPLDPVSYDGNVLVSLMPNAIRPLVEIAQNVTFTGKPIYRESDFNKYDPSFKKAYAGTPDFLLRYSKWMNSIGNKYPEAQQGPVEQTAVGRYANNPAVIDHLLKSYLGGMYTLGSQIAGAITKASDEETRKDFKTADIPFFSKFVANPNDRPQSKNKGDAYWQDFEKYQRSSHTLGVIRQDARKTGNFSVLEDFYKSEEYKEMKEYEPKAKQRKEEQKYERWKEEGNADLYQPHQQTGEDVYKRHSTPADDFEDTKASILYQKIKPAKDIFDLADINTPSGMDTFNKYYDLAGKVEEAHSVKKEMNAIVKSFVNDEHKTTFDPEKMKEYRALRKQYLQLVEDGNRMFEKIKAQRN